MYQVCGIRGCFSLLLASVLFAADSPHSQSIIGKVIGITDGDTISVLCEGKALTIRLDGIDAPEAHQPFGAVAKQFVSGQAFGKEVTVQVKGTDSYGRTIGQIMLPSGSNLNHEIVRSGLAWWYWQYSKDIELAQLEATAKIARRGLWSDSKAIAPWEFRRGGATCAPAEAETTTAGAIPQRPTPQVRTTTPSPARTQTREQTVYITRTGAKYHRSGCSSLRYSAYPMAKSEAQSRGYGACLRCNP